MRNGRKKHLVELQQRIEINGDLGDKDIAYVTPATGKVFAGIEPGGKIGGRKYNDDQDNVFNRVLIVFDYHPDFDSSWRILHVETGVVYKVIRLVDPQLRNIEYQAECESLTDV